jgi:kynureninase
MSTSSHPDPVSFEPGEAFARRLDDQDPLADFRNRFHLPRAGNGQPLLYFCGNSLGLQPIGAGPMVEQELASWAGKAVAGHFAGAAPWYDYHRQLSEPLARLAGCSPAEVVAMNSLTVNLHLMMTSFYRPAGLRHKILMEDCAFPSDTYAVKSQIALHGFDPEAALLIARPRPGEATLRTEDLEALLAERGAEIALVILEGVSYFTGQALDCRRLTAAARRAGCLVGFDLAHAIGNIPLALHDWEVDFAIWCSYKYLNAGPGAVGGCFVHEKHGDNPALPRLAGWWGNDPGTRFRMHLQSDFIPVRGAEGWQVSNPPILSMAPLRASLALFDAAGLGRLREKSLLLTGYLDYLIRRIPGDAYRILTPQRPAERGCQLSIQTKVPLRSLLGALEARDIVADGREPDVVRIAPVPFYNRFAEVWQLSRALEESAGSA